MGRIVINKTENGQTLILNDTAQEVSGGYFDSVMVWHDLTTEPVYPDYSGYFDAVLRENHTYDLYLETDVTELGGIDSIYARNVTIVGATSIKNNSSISQWIFGVLSLPTLETIGMSAWNYKNRQVTCINIPNVRTVGSNFYITTNSYKSENLVKMIIGTSPFTSNNSLSLTPALKALVITAETVPTLYTDISSFSVATNTDCYIYVPSALVESYKVANNWSAVVSKFRAIEDYPRILEASTWTPSE